MVDSHEAPTSPQDPYGFNIIVRDGRPGWQPEQVFSVNYSEIVPPLETVAGTEAVAINPSNVEPVGWLEVSGLKLPVVARVSLGKEKPAEYLAVFMGNLTYPDARMTTIGTYHYMSTPYSGSLNVDRRYSYALVDVGAITDNDGSGSFIRRDGQFTGVSMDPKHPTVILQGKGVTQSAPRYWSGLAAASDNNGGLVLQASHEGYVRYNSASPLSMDYKPQFGGISAEEMSANLASVVRSLYDSRFRDPQPQAPATPEEAWVEREWQQASDVPNKKRYLKVAEHILRLPDDSPLNRDTIVRELNKRKPQVSKPFLNSGQGGFNN